MCDPVTTALLVGSAATAGTATVAATAATAGLIGAGGAVTAAGALSGLSAASGIAGVIGQQQAASSMAASNSAQYNNALLARAQNANQINLERVQAGDAAGQKLNANNMAMREAQSSVVARAGPSGLSVDALLADMGRKGAGYNESVTSNLDRTNMALDNQLQNVNNQAASTINNLKTPAPVDYLGAALKIGEGYQKYKANT